ncbi:MAG: hypothetical protein HQL21_09700 [Candidatus Omnitrophica bacterium]|nr:hypothetical protein [Candidatus Omnitrophota bacterium]
MWEIYFRTLPQYPKIDLTEERLLIAKAQQGNKIEAEEMVLRHIGFVIFRIRRIAFPSYIARFGEDILSQAIFILYEKIQTYNLDYRDRHGELRPVRFSSYIWKRIDGFILDTLKKESRRESCQFSPDWERYEGGETEEAFEDG